ncbi:MAG: hypothetical protein JSW66_12775 [Phycisphaerales bacterium]|nr:MAG: hypothetical protein JSW66_12775 [Phycisphaerales bacterium]
MWAELRFAGIRTSREHTGRPMREHGLQALRTSSVVIATRCDG